jgi:hypothetical protein
LAGCDNLGSVPSGNQKRKVLTTSMEKGSSSEQADGVKLRCLLILYHFGMVPADAVVQAAYEDVMKTVEDVVAEAAHQDITL